MDFVALLLMMDTLTHLFSFCIVLGSFLDSGVSQWVPKIINGPTTLVSQDIFVAEGIDQIQPANNNVGAILFNDQLFMAWRSAPTHFASSKTRMHVVSSTDFGQTWAHELTIDAGTDLREPYFLDVNGTLFFYYVEAGVNPIAFEPGRMQQRQYLDPGWSKAEIWGQESEIAWQYGIKDGIALTISYSGMHYSLAELGQVNLFLNFSEDGRVWNNGVGLASPFYTGGISEVGWTFDADGIMWGVGRNEDGDDSGWGSRLFYFDPESMSEPQWTNDRSDPHIYESPRMFTHRGEVYLVARTDPKGPFMSNNTLNNFPPVIHHLYDLVAYSFRPHGTAIWRLDRVKRTLERVLDLPGCGDTAFPSIVPMDEDHFMIFNYSSPQCEEDEEVSWIVGQVSPEGTLIYALTIEFQEI